MPDYDGFAEEPSHGRRKYRIYSQACKNNPARHWTILLSFAPVDFDRRESESTSSSPLAGSGPGGHKASFKSTKLAKRARSFKDDFLEKLSQMRSPTNQGVRSQSPKGRPVKNYIIQEDMAFNNKGPIQELHHQQKQISIALKHFRDVVLKKKLEMLPGNGTIVLDTIWAINLTVQRSTVSPECGEMIKRATDYMYASVAKLIKLCDDALIDEQSSALDEPNVVEVVKHVEKSVESLIKLVQQKITHPNVMYMTTPRASYSASNLDMPAQRNSLPDIPLTDREREILEKNSSTPRMVRSSHSTESILRDSSPPPKPPLPHNMYRKDTDTYITPPPLPPKKRNMDNYVVCYNSDNSIFQSSLERMSLRSRSPEDSSSLLSASAGSLDSVLNHSREEEEITALMDHNTDNDTVMENDLSEITGNGFANYLWQDQDSFLNTTHPSLLNHSGDLHVNNSDYNRLSNTDSGFMSVQSHRSSSYSKRSSQQSSSSSQWNAQQFSAKQSSSSVSEMIKSESISQNLRSCSENHTFLNMQSLSQKSSAYVSNFSSNQKSIIIGDETDSSLIGDCVPPAIPQKTRRKPERQPSPYDNVPDTNLGGELLVTCQMHQSHQSLSSNTSITNVHQDGNCPPPLPPKKKHMFQSVAYSVMAYMEMFGNCSHSSDQEFMRHSVHIQGHWAQSPKPGLPTTQSCSFSHTSSHSSSRSSHTQVQTLTLPHSSGDNSPIPSPMRSPNLALTPINSTPPALPPKRSRSSSSRSSPPATPRSTSIMEMKSPIKSLPDLLEHTTLPKPNEEVPESLDPTNLCDIDLMEETDVIKYLIFKTTDEDGPDIRGGCIDALIIQATKATKNGVFAYQEAFLTTYRTFITPFDLISKLIRRYKHFKRQPDKKPKEAFALVIRVVNDLTPGDLDRDMQQTLMDFVQELICSGDITLAKALRVKHLERHDAKQLSIKLFSNPNQDVVIQPFKQTMMTLVDFKSEQIAEQMTYLDAELFMKIEIPEVLIWAQEQNEERSPNLTKFTEHFNKMSYWARAKILKADDAKDREKYFMKFIKIMKHLRKINNFNSYLALLSALDSAPIRRLEWQKHVQDGLKEYCALIDSSSSFRAYRQALAETQPPCIPYIGLVLQDLTFVHIGNSNVVTNNGVSYINFSKRWQQYNIVENMKKFKKCAYAFKRNDKIIDFFNNFKCDIDEDEMWNISESIKPRGSKKPAQ